jgi:pimeloyl-ACP methyl ester carboxylesterase
MPELVRRGKVWKRDAMGPPLEGRHRRWVLLGLLFGLFLAAAGGVFARWPLWTFSKLTQARLAWAGVYRHSLFLDGLEVSYLEGGKGKPIVFVHGIGGQSQDWAALLRELVRDGFHVLAMDLPGFGETSKPRERSYSISQQANFVKSFLDAMRLERVTLVGVSMGGWIAATVALDQPQRVEKLVLMDSAGFAFKPSFDTTLFTPRTPAQVEMLLALVTPRPPRVPNFVKEDVVRQSGSRGWVIERALASMGTGAGLLDGRFSSMKPPLLLLWGKQDGVTPLTLGEAMHKAVPNSVLEVYDGCGHLAFATCADRVAPRLRGFLAGSGPPAGATIDVPAE